MQYRTLSELEKLEGNPRFIEDKEFQTLCDSIRDNPKYFEARPLILSDRTGKLIIIAGNQRYEAAKVVKLKKVPTFLIEGLTEEKEREITIRDNVNNGVWDMDALANSWDDLPLFEWGVNVPTIAEICDYEEKSVFWFKKTHILLSFNPEKLNEIQEHLEKILEVDGIEYDQTSN